LLDDFRSCVIQKYVPACCIRLHKDVTSFVWQQIKLSFAVDIGKNSQNPNACPIYLSIQPGEIWYDIENGCNVKKTCTNKTYDDGGCHITEILDNGTSDCATELEFEKANCLENWEIAIEVEKLRSCCPRYNCSKYTLLPL